MKNKEITGWLEWRYPDVWRELKRHMRQDPSYCPDKGVHGQDFENLSRMAKGFCKTFNLELSELRLDKKGKRVFSHINIMLR